MQPTIIQAGALGSEAARRDNPLQLSGGAADHGRLGRLSKNSPALTWHRVSKSFGHVQAVDEVTIQVTSGEVLGLLGPNGAGKSTLLSMAAGLERPDTGEVVSAGPARVGFMPQEYALYPTLSAWENAMYVAGLWRLTRSEARKESERVIELVGLSHHRHAQVKTLSGGMRRRLSLGIALLGSPAVLLLDEPTVGVDPQSRVALLDMITAARDSGVAVVYSSHYMEEVQMLADRVAILHQGRLLCEGQVNDLIGERGETTLELEVITPRASELDRLLSGCDSLCRSAQMTVQCDVASLSFHVVDRETALATVLQATRSLDATVVDLRLREPTLEAVFMTLTGRQLCE